MQRCGSAPTPIGCRTAPPRTATQSSSRSGSPTDDAAPNGARFLFLIDGASSARLGEFDRVFDLFDGNDEAAVVAARGRWTAAKAAGYTLTYWQQGARGWEKKA